VEGDYALAAELGCHPTTVLAARRVRGRRAAEAPWVPDGPEEMAIRLHWGTMEAAEIAVLIHRSPGAVWHHAIYILRLGSPGRGTWTQDQVAAHLGISVTALRKLYPRAKVRPMRRPHYARYCRTCAEGLPCPRPLALTDEQVEKLEAQLVEELDAAA
jgi:hypothetical protein